MRKIEIIAFLITFLPVTAGAANINTGNLDRQISGLEKKLGELSVVVYEPVTGKVEYAYNKRLAFSGKYPPGSLFKVFSALYLLSGNGFQPQKKIECNGRFMIPGNIRISEADKNIFNLRKDADGGYFLKCSKNHGMIDLKQAVSKSCNTYFLTQSARNPGQVFHALEKDWLVSGGSTARIPGYSDRYHLRDNYSDLQKAAAAIGEGGIFLASPLKIAQIFGAVWMNTPLLSPFEGHGSPLMAAQNKMSAATLFFIHSALNDTIRTGTLSGVAANKLPITVLGGKTGSGTWIGHKYKNHAWNVLLLSVQGKKLVLVSFVKNGTGSREGQELSKLVLGLL